MLIFGAIMKTAKVVHQEETIVAPNTGEKPLVDDLKPGKTVKKALVEVGQDRREEVGQ